MEERLDAQAESIAAIQAVLDKIISVPRTLNVISDNTRREAATKAPACQHSAEVEENTKPLAAGHGEESTNIGLTGKITSRKRTGFLIEFFSDDSHLRLDNPQQDPPSARIIQRVIKSMFTTLGHSGRSLLILVAYLAAAWIILQYFRLALNDEYHLCQAYRTWRRLSIHT